MKKDGNLKVRIDQKQKEEILDLCRKAGGITQSEFIRQLLKKRDLESIKIFSADEKKIFEEINFSLKKVGTNINQISHFLNLEHLKGLDNFKSIMDVIILDKLKESQINSLKSDIEKLTGYLDYINQKLEEGYERKT
jgi:hypothetical protein